MLWFAIFVVIDLLRTGHFALQPLPYVYALLRCD